jgi:hypothetical protein
MKRRAQTGVLTGIGVLVAATGAANASFLPAFTGTTPAGSNTQFNYDFVFATAGATAPIERLENGDFLTIYDIPGFVSATGPANFSVSTQNLGINGTGTTPADDPALPNVTFTYTGPTVTVDTFFNGASIVSSFGLVGLDNYTSETTRVSDGSTIGHIGLVPVPAIPEPGTLIFLSALPLALLRRR